MKPMMRSIIGIAPLMVLLCACDKMADSSRAVQSVTHKAFNDTRSSWKDFFTYHPPAEDPLPQTRYCYQMQSDIVCYDSQQSSLTAKMVGFQEGETISWVQPGGGALGASGGAPIALRPVAPQKTLNKTPSINDFLPNLNFRSGGAASSATQAPEPVQGSIDVKSLPPINSVAKVGQAIN